MFFSQVAHLIYQIGFLLSTKNLIFFRHSTHCCFLLPFYINRLFALLFFVFFLDIMFILYYYCISWRFFNIIFSFFIVFFAFLCKKNLHYYINMQILKNTSIHLLLLHYINYNILLLFHDQKLHSFL